MVEVWLALVSRLTKKGHAAYAGQMADMYQWMANTCDRFTAAPGTCPAEGVAVAEYTHPRRPSGSRGLIFRPTLLYSSPYFIFKFRIEI